MKEVSLSGQDSEVHSKVEIFAVDNGQEAVSNLLSDVQDPREIHQALVMLAKLTNSSDEEAAVEFK